MGVLPNLASNTLGLNTTCLFGVGSIVFINLSPFTKRPSTFTIKGFHSEYLEPSVRTCQTCSGLAGRRVSVTTSSLGIIAHAVAFKAAIKRANTFNMNFIIFPSYLKKKISDILVFGN